MNVTVIQEESSGRLSHPARAHLTFRTGQCFLRNVTIWHVKTIGLYIHDTYMFRGPR